MGLFASKPSRSRASGVTLAAQQTIKVASTTNSTVVSEPKRNSETDRVTQMEGGIEYQPHSMMHKAIVRMEPTKLEMLDGFEKVDSGHKFVPTDSNVRVMITGRDWAEKRVLLYGSKSSTNAQNHVETIIERVRAIGHEAEVVRFPEISNIAVSGEFDFSLQLEAVMTDLQEEQIDIEYEPEQFPAAIVKLDEPPVTFLLFSTGSFVIQGLQAFDDIEKAIKQMNDLLK